MGFFHNMVSRLKKNDFLKSVIILMSGSTVAQFLPVLISPVFTRVFTPEQIGIYGVYVAAVNIITQFVCLKYDVAIVISEEKEEAGGLFWLCLSVTGVLSVLLLLTYPFARPISALLGSKDSFFWVYYIPVSTLLIGLNTALNYYNVRLKAFTAISTANITKTVVQSIVQVALGFLGFGIHGLIIGQIASFLAGNMRLIKNVLKAISFSSFNKKNIFRLLVKHRQYPAYILTGSLSNSLTYNLIPFFMSSFYSPSQCGYYTMINRVLGSPINLIGSAVGQVFLKQASDEKNGKQLLSPIFNKISKILLLMSVPIFAVLFIFGRPLFTVVLGKEYGDTIPYLRALIPMFLVRFVVSPVQSSAVVMGKQRTMMIWQIGLLVISVIPAVVSSLWKMDIVYYLLILSLALAAAYLIFYYYCRRIISEEDKRKLESSKEDLP